MRRLSLLVLGLVALAGVSPLHSSSDEVGSFRYAGQYLVPGGTAEIVAATPNGRTLVFTDATRDVIGALDITHPARPVALWESVPGQPITSLAIEPDGEFALVTAVSPGRLLVLRISDGSVVGSVALGTQPDALSITRVGSRTVAVVAVENEQAGEAGLVQVVTLNFETPSASVVRDITFPAAMMTAAGLLAVTDPQPEFVDIRGTRAAVTLQENNGLAIIDIADPHAPTIAALFSLGVVADRAADLRADLRIQFSEIYPAGTTAANAGTRQADAVAWNAAGTVLYTANEGEANFTGGRGPSAFSPEGALLWDDGGALEQIAVTRGQYPDGRSNRKGIEPEGAETGVFGGREFLFIGAERGSFVAVFDIAGDAPRFVQLLPAGTEPEGILALPRRRLLVVASEGLGAGVITIFRGVEGPEDGTKAAPILQSSPGTFWNALSGLSGDPEDGGRLFALPDAALVSSIYRIDLDGTRAHLAQHAPVTKAGVQQRYDMEGIAVDTSIAATKPSRGFWLGIEGNAAFGAATYKPNLLVQTDAAGAVLQEVRLPMAIDSATGGLIRSQGFEGVAVSPDGRYLLAPIQRPFAAEPAVGAGLHTRIARYDLQTGAWAFFFYPLDTNVPPPVDDWVGLSEITSLGHDWYAVIERDKLFGAGARVKRVYAFTLEGVPAFDGTVLGPPAPGQAIQKHLFIDAAAATSPFEKIEGLGLTAGGQLWSVIDNDGGLHDSRLRLVRRLRRERKDDDDDDTRDERK